MHPLDTADRQDDRRRTSTASGCCNITKCCTEVCPEHIKITDNALIPMKERVVDRKYDPLVWLGRKIFRRDQLDAPAPTLAAAGAKTASGDLAVADTSSNWHQEGPTPQEAPVGADGKLVVAELHPGPGRGRLAVR